jgi:hypothetical protein
MIARIDRNWIILGLSALAMVAAPWWLLSREPADIPKAEPLMITKVHPREIATLSALTQKPIFNPERAPLAFADEMMAAADDTAVDPQVQSAPAPTLVGLVSRRRGKSVAIVKNANGETKTLTPGQSSDGWQLVAVGKSDARFSSNGEQISINLDFGNKALGGPAGRPGATEISNMGEPE